MKEYISTFIYFAVFYAMANYMCEKIFQLGVIYGAQATGNHLHEIRKKSKLDRNVVSYPFDKKETENEASPETPKPPA